MPRTSWLSALVLVVTALPLLAQEEPPPTPLEQPAADAVAVHDLRLVIRPDQEMLIDSDTKVKMKLSMEKDGQKQTMSADVTSELLLVDRCLEIDDKVCRTERYFAKWLKKVGGDVDDPEINGVTVELREEGGSIYRRTEDGRVLTEKLANSVLSQGESVFLWTRLPEAAEVGKTYELGLRTLVPFLLDLDEYHETSVAKLTLRSVSETGRAKLLGPFEITARQSVGGDMYDVAFQGDLDLDLDLGAGVIDRLRYKGTFSGKPLVPAFNELLEGSFDVKVETSLDPKKIADVRNKRLTIRDKVREMAFYGLAFELPTDWMFLSDENNRFVYVPNLAGDRSLIEFAAFRAEDPKAEVKAAAESVAAQNEGAKTSTIRTGKFGQGRSVTWMGEDGRTFVYDFIPDKDTNRVLRLILISPPGMEKDALKVLADVRKSLRRL